MSEFLTLQKILTALNSPIEEEHCWAIVNGLFSSKKDRTLNDYEISPSSDSVSLNQLKLDDILIWKNGDVQIRQPGVGGELFDLDNIDHGKLFSSIGLLLWQALDFGLSKEEERNLKQCTLTLLETLIDPEHSELQTRSSRDVINYIRKACATQVENRQDDEAHYKQVLKNLYHSVAVLRSPSSAFTKNVPFASSAYELSTDSGRWNDNEKNIQLRRCHAAVVQELHQQDFQLKAVSSQTEIRCNDVVLRRPKAPTFRMDSPALREGVRFSCYNVGSPHLYGEDEPKSFSQAIEHRRLSLRKAPSTDKLCHNFQKKGRNHHEQLMQSILSRPALTPVNLRQINQCIPPPEPTPHESLMQSIAKFDKGHLKNVVPKETTPEVVLRRPTAPTFLSLRPHSLLTLHNDRRTASSIRLRVDEISSIRTAVTNFQMDSYVDFHPQLYARLSKDEVCFLCFKSFGWFMSSVGNSFTCQVCKKKICKKCGLKGSLLWDLKLDVRIDAMLPHFRAPSMSSLSSTFPSFESDGMFAHDMVVKRPSPAAVKSDGFQFRNLFKQVLKPVNSDPFVCNVCLSLFPTNCVGLFTP